MSCWAGRVWRYPARLAPSCSAAAAARWFPVGSCQLQMKVLAWFSDSACSVTRGHMAHGGVAGRVLLLWCPAFLLPQCAGLQSIGYGVDIWWLWWQRNLLTSTMNVESLTRDGLWLREEVKIIVYTYNCPGYFWGMLCAGVGRESRLEDVWSVFPGHAEAVGLWSQLL